ncbi:hypothetical protein CSKR_105802 [Clonorchis sinensis]|uniref:Uncharacterized protein n=1 Tax=Clonorchis sinensis TaxID=79923 RepID=A0A3R7FG29_CLOSI|nr:hypothetical protein CSKR_105802 [Clonorchis sinensis]
MTVPCHHCTDMLRFMDSPVTVVEGAAIGEGIRSSVAAGSGPGSEPPAMDDTPVLLEGRREYERTMVQLRRRKVRFRRCNYGLKWARSGGRDSEENNCRSAIRLRMVVSCHRYTEILRFPDSPVKVVRVAAIGQAIGISMAAGSGLDEETDTDRDCCPPLVFLGVAIQVTTGTGPVQLQANHSRGLLWFSRMKGQAQNHRRWAMHPCYWRGDGYKKAPWCNVTR